MRPLSIICALAFIFASATVVSTQPSIPSAASEKLFGPIKSLDHSVISYRMVEGKLQPREPRPFKGLRFDRAGKMIESVSYDHHGKLIGKSVYTFEPGDAPNGYRSYSSTGNSPDLAYVQDYLFKRDSVGRVIEYLVTEGKGDLLYKVQYKFDKSGNLVEVTHYSRFGTLLGRTVTTDGPGKQRTTQIAYNAKGEQTRKAIEERDADGRITWQQQYRGTTLKYEIKTTYDAKGRPLEEVTTEFNPNPNEFLSHSPRPGRLVYRYDDEKNSVELSRFDGEGKLKGREVRWYDSKGNETEMAEYGLDGNEIPETMHFYDNISKPNSPYRGSLSGRRITRFEYDHYGNWTRKKYFIRTADVTIPTLFREERRILDYF